MSRFSFDHLEDHPLLDGTRSLRKHDRLVRHGAGVLRGRSLKAMLMGARDLMSHQNPSGKHEAVLIGALELLILALKKQKFATSGSGNRRVTSDVKE
jgi:hypothetical protein